MAAPVLERPVGVTVLPRHHADEPAPVPRQQLGRPPAQDRFVVWGARVAALALAWIVVDQLLPVSGLWWYVVVAALANVVVLGVATAATDRTVAVSDRVAQWLISAGATVVFAALASTVFFVFKRGWPAMQHLNFYTDTMAGVGPDAPLTQGGILNAIVGSLIELGIAVAVTLPLGVGTAVFMNEIGGRFARIVRTVVEAMTALPSIVAGLFVYTVWIIALGFPRSGLAGALAIGVMMLPIIARASDVVLRVVPGSLREASLALGASRWATVWNVVLPTARPGLATALILGIARGIGETSPVLITSGMASFMVTNPFDGVMNSLPLSIFGGARSPEPLMITRAFGTAGTLLVLVLVLFVLARLAARPAGAAPGPLTRVRRLVAAGVLGAVSRRRPAPATAPNQEVAP
jgi:phosphate transport system permease protein